MQKLSICVGQGQGVEGQRGGRGRGQREYLKLFISDCGTHMAVGGVRGGAMMGVGRVVGKGVGRGFN